MQWPDRGVEDAATERPEVLQSAVWVGALNPGNTPSVVATQKALHCLGDPLQAELSEALGEVSFIPGVQVGEVGAEKPLERTCAPLAVDAGWRRIQGQGHLKAIRFKLAWTDPSFL